MWLSQEMIEVLRPITSSTFFLHSFHTDGMPAIGRNEYDHSTVMHTLKHHNKTMLYS